MVPTEDDLIIPHPSFHINDLIHLEVIDSLHTDAKRVPSSEEETFDDSVFADMEQAILSFINTGRPLSHFHTILLPVYSLAISLLETERDAVDFHRSELLSPPLPVNRAVLRVPLQLAILLSRTTETLLSSSCHKPFGTESYKDSFRSLRAAPRVQR